MSFGERVRILHFRKKINWTKNIEKIAEKTGGLNKRLIWEDKSIEELEKKIINTRDIRRDTRE